MSENETVEVTVPITIRYERTDTAIEAEDIDPTEEIAIIVSAWLELEADLPDNVEDAEVDFDGAVVTTNE